MYNSNISFKSNIRLVSPNKFSSEVSKLPVKNSVNYPWTAREIISRPKAYTTGILDCVAGGITDGKKVVMFHICPTYDENKDFNLIEKTILKKFKGETSNLKGLVLCNNTQYQESKDLLNNFKGFIQNLGIDCSVISGIKKNSPSSIAYDGKNDDWMIANECISDQLKKGVKDLRGILDGVFNEVKISPTDLLKSN